MAAFDNVKKDLESELYTVHSDREKLQKIVDKYDKKYHRIDIEYMHSELEKMTSKYKLAEA